MKIVVVDSKTRQYLKSQELEYTRYFDEALDFPDIRKAKEFCHQHNLRKHIIFARCDRLGLESYLCDV